MTRICCVFGPWQLITLVAALRHTDEEASVSSADVCHDDYLVLYETAGVSQEFKDILDRMARAAWPWKRIVWAYDLLVNRSRFTPSEFARMQETLRERIGVAASQAGELWVCYLTRPAEKLVFETFPQARIILYEDGLISYIPIEFAAGMDPNAAPPRTVVERLRRRMRERRERLSPSVRFRHSGGNLDPRHLARVTGTYLQLTPDEPLPNTLARVSRHCVAYPLLRSVLEQVAQALKSELDAALPRRDEAAPNRLLILGQALSRNGIMTCGEELALYRAIIHGVLAKGYIVLWKEHPRISEPFFDELAADTEGQQLQQLRLPHAYPVELVAHRLQLAGCVAGTSAAPFYLRRLYGIPCFTFADDLLSYMKGVDVFMNRMVRHEATPLEELPPYKELKATT